MTYSVDWTAKVITVPLDDLTFVSGSVWSLDVSAFWIEVRRLEASPEEGLGREQALEFINTQILSGITYSPIVKLINGYTWKTGTTNKVITLLGPNGNLLDTFITGDGVSVLANNSAGKTDDSDSGVTTQNIIDIVDAIMARVIENGETFSESIKLIRAEAAGTIERTGDVHKIKSADGLTDRITATADVDGRTVTAVDTT
ncbi:MAG: hypothetical protein GY820_21070 [Gammaproteobacteria bacterium]|nr:hypothetical protein [Gammaproteobacteria bacterium]